MSTTLHEAQSATNNPPVTPFTPLVLPCGRTVRNRLVKVALYEHLAPIYGGSPNKHHFGLYAKWSKYDWGMIITGNVQVSPLHMSLGRDISIPKDITETTLEPFVVLASIMRGDVLGKGSQQNEGGGGGQREESGGAQPLAIMQLSHAGRQSTKFVGGRSMGQRPLGPSEIRVASSKDTGLLSRMFHAILFQTPTAMSTEDIDEVVEEFVKGATVAWKAGFDGIQLHGAHGYLLAQFLSPKTNQRTDEYSTSDENVLRLLQRVVDGIRRVVPKDFILGVKINAGDYADSKTSETEEPEDRALKHIKKIAGWEGIDFIEVSGGDYEKPDFVAAKVVESKSSRKALFDLYSQEAMKIVNPDPNNAARLPVIMLTGGLRTPELFDSVLTTPSAHLLGIGRGAVTCPDLPNLLRATYEQRSELPDANVASWDKPFRPDPDLTPGGNWLWKRMPKIPLLGAGVNVAWYDVMMRRLAGSSPSDDEKDLAADYKVGGVKGVVKMWLWKV